MMPIKLKRKTHVRPFKLNSLNRLKFRFFQNRTRSHLERDVIRIISSSFSLVVISFSNGSSIYRKCIVVKEMEAEGSGQRRGCRRWPSKFTADTPCICTGGCSYEGKLRQEVVTGYR